jgi:hypothetical protein
MPRIVGGVLVLLLALPAAQGQDKDKQATPAAQQYQALLEEYNQQMRVYQDAVKNAKTPEEQRKVFEEKYPNRETLAPKFIALADKNPTDPVAVQALQWVLGDPRGGQSPAAREVRAKAMELLIRDHLQSDKLGQVCMGLGFGVDRTTEKFLRAVMAKNPHKDAQAEACVALAQTLDTRARIVKIVKEDPGSAARLESLVGKEEFEELKKTDPAKVDAETAAVYKELADKYATDMKTERLTMLVQRLGRGGAGADTLLRTVLEKDKRREVQGFACISLALVLRKQADDIGTKDAKKLAQLHGEAEELLERAVKDFADLKTGRGTIADQAKRELFDLRNLAVGKTAPDVEAEDQDGRKFKLSDYKGKVVLLDFWSQY